MISAIVWGGRCPQSGWVWCCITSSYYLLAPLNVLLEGQCRPNNRFLNEGRFLGTSNNPAWFIKSYIHLFGMCWIIPYGNIIFCRGVAQRRNCCSYCLYMCTPPAWLSQFSFIFGGNFCLVFRKCFWRSGFDPELCPNTLGRAIFQNLAFPTNPKLPLCSSSGRHRSVFLKVSVSAGCF